MPRVVVVGGGVSGLSAAHALQSLRPDAEVIVLESAPRVGGKVATLRRDGFTVEAGPNGFLDTGPAMTDLARSVGLEASLVPASEAAGRNRFLLLDGRLRKFPSGVLSFLSSDLLSPLGKLDLLMERFRPRKRGGGDESIDSFLRRRAGREIAHTLGDAFVTGILAGDPKLLSMGASFPRLAGYELDHGSVTAGMSASRVPGRRQRMWSFPGGLQTLTDAVAAGLRTPPRTGVDVRSLSRTPGGWRVEGLDADAVILACPAPAQAALLRPIDEGLATLVGTIPYNRIAVVALGYRRADVPHPLDGFGYLSPQRERRDVLGMQWCSSIFAGRAPDGHVLVRALCGGWHRGDIVEWEDGRLIAAVRREMARAAGTRAAPVFSEVIRWREAIPQYRVGHPGRLRRIDELAARHPGLILGGSAYRGVALNDCVEQGRAAAGRAAAVLPR